MRDEPAETAAVEQLAHLHGHASALIASGVLQDAERTAMFDVRDRLDAMVARLRRADAGCSKKPSLLAFASTLGDARAR